MMHLFNPFHRPKAPKAPTPEEVAAQDLEEARKELLKQQKLKEYHTAMVTMLEARVARLSRTPAQQLRNVV